MKSIFDEENRKKYRFIIGISVFFGLFAHGYRLVNNIYTHDALMDLVEDNIQYQRSLGRFMQTFTILFRGSACAPWLIGVISLIFISFSVFLVGDLFQIKKYISIAMIAGIMICNVTITSSAAAFIPWMDVYSVALFLAVLGTWLISKNKLVYYIAGGAAIVLSLGFYQAYVEVAVTLLLIFFLKRFREESNIKQVWISVAKAVGTLIVLAGCYYGLYKFVCRLHHVQVNNNYNSLETMNTLWDTSMRDLLIATYRNFFAYFAKPSGFAAKIGGNYNIWASATAVASVGVLILVVAGLFIQLLKRKAHWSVWAVHAVAVFIVPLLANGICLISKGVNHVLALYSFTMMFVWAIALWEECALYFTSKAAKAFKAVALLFTLVCVWDNVVFSNQLYFRLDLQDRAFESFASRLVNDIENTQGYEYRNTKVVFYGSFENSDYFTEIPQIGSLNMLGVGKTPITYMSTFYNFSTYYLNTFINVELGGNLPEAVLNMPCYPSKGSIIYDGEQVIVKISE